MFNVLLIAHGGAVGGANCCVEAVQGRVITVKGLGDVLYTGAVIEPTIHKHKPKWGAGTVCLRALTSDVAEQV